MPRWTGVGGLLIIDTPLSDRAQPHRRDTAFRLKRQFYNLPDGSWIMTNHHSLPNNLPSRILFASCAPLAWTISGYFSPDNIAGNTQPLPRMTPQELSPIMRIACWL
jgi:hypothetical protein